MKNTMKYLLFAALIATLVFSYGCSIKNPSDSFKLAIDGKFEKAILDSLRATTGGIDTTLATNLRLTGTSPSDEADGSAAVAIPFTPVPALVLAEINAINSGSTAALTAICSGTFRNNGSNPITVGLYITNQGSLNTGIVNQSAAQILGFTIPANSTFSTASNTMTSYLTPVDVLTLINAINSNSRLYFYVYVSATSSVDLTIVSLSMTLPAAYTINQNVNPGDVSSYSLQSLANIGIGGTATISPVLGSAGCDSVVITVSCKSGTGSDTTAAGMVEIGRKAVANSSHISNFSFSLDSLSASLISTSGRTVLTTRFTEMFPPSSLSSFFRVSFTTYSSAAASSWRYTVDNLRVIANARVQRN